MKTFSLAEFAQILFEEAGDALFLFDPESEQIVEANRLAEQLSGLGRQDLLRHQVTSLFRAEVPGGMQRLRQAFRQTGPVHLQEGYFLRQQQQWIPVHLTVIRLHAESETLGLITARDLRGHHEIQARLQQKEIELNRLRASEAGYRRLFERNLAGVFRSTPAGRLLDCNDAFARILGYASRHDLLDHNALKLYAHPEDRPRLLDQLRDRGHLANYELCLSRNDGTPVWILENVSLLEDAGQPVLEGTIVDITERKRIEETLTASEAKYRTLIENLEQCIFLKDRSLRFVAANRPFCRAAGCPEAELIGKNDFDFFPAHLAEKYRADDLVVLTEGRRLDLEEQNQQAGKLRTVRVIKTPVKDERGAVVGVLGIFWDVTEQLSLEAQLRQAQKMEAIGQLAGGIAHDFNNLLTVMLGNVSFALDRLGPGNASHELLHNAQLAGLRAADLTQRLLGFSRRTMLRPQPLNLNQAVEETVRFLRRTLDPRLQLDLRLADDLGLVLADPGQINQVLMNLALNARDAMPQGGQLIFETTHFTPDADYRRLNLEARPGEFVRLSVRDTGTGMSAEIRQRIFEPFFTTKETGKGTGLGLAMVFGIIEQHQGWITCDSSPGQGTRFDLFLPRLLQAPIPAPLYAAPVLVTGQGTILLVDDEPLVRNLGKRILESCGYTVRAAEDGAQALEVYREQKDHIDLIILDGTMPQLSGRDTLLRLRELNPRVRVLFSSGYAAEHHQLADIPQVVAYLNKPYRMDELAAKVRDILEKTRAN